MCQKKIQVDFDVLVCCIYMLSKVSLILFIVHSMQGANAKTLKPLDVNPWVWGCITPI